MRLFESLSARKSQAFTVVLNALACASLLAAASAVADTTPATSVVSGKKAAPKFFDNVTFSYFGIFAGPSLGTPNNYQPNDQGVIEESDANRIALKNSFTLGYNITKEVNAGAVFNFNYYPVLPFSTQGADLKDPALKLSHSKMIHVGNFNVAGDFRFAIPATDASQQKNLITSFRAWQTTTYEVKNTRLTLGAYTFEKMYFYGSNAKADAMRLEAYLAPFVSYQLSKATSISLTYEMDAMSKSNESITTWVPEDPTDLALGLSVDVTPNVNLNPFIQIFPGGNINLDSTQFGAYISAKLL